MDPFSALRAGLLDIVGQFGIEPFSGARFSVKHVVHIHTQLTRQRGGVTAHNVKAIIELLRVLAEVIVHGDAKEPRVFETFLELKMLDALVGLAHVPPNSEYGRAVVVQVLQTLSIITQNVQTTASIYSLLSNGQLDSLFQIAVRFEDEELVCNYITLIKALALRVTDTTVQFFVREGGRLPLFEEAVRFSRSTDPLVLSAVRSIALSLCALTGDMEVRRIVLATSTRAGYWQQLASRLGLRTRELAAQLGSAGGAAAARWTVEDLLDDLYYANDVMACDKRTPADRAPEPALSLSVQLTRELASGWLEPAVLAPLVAAGSLAERAALLAPLLVLVHAVLLIEARDFQDATARLLLAPSSGGGVNPRRVALLALLAEGGAGDSCPTLLAALVLLAAIGRAGAAEGAHAPTRPPAGLSRPARARVGDSNGDGDGYDEELVGALLLLLASGLRREQQTLARTRAQLLCAAAELLVSLTRRCELSATHTEPLARLIAAGKSSGQSAASELRAISEGDAQLDHALLTAWRSAPAPILRARGVGAQRGSRGALGAVARDLELRAPSLEPADSLGQEQQLLAALVGRYLSASFAGSDKEDDNDGTIPCDEAQELAQLRSFLEL
jgi:hypothetical protein